MKGNGFYIVIATALLAISLYFNVKLVNTSRHDAERLEVLSKITKDQSGIISKYVAPDSSKHVVYKLVYAKNDAEKGMAISSTYIDSLKKSLNIQAGRIEELTRVKATVSATVKTELKKDSNGRDEYSYKGKWLNFLLKTKDSTATYKYNIDMLNLIRTEGNWLTGRKKFRDISFADPDAEIQGVTGFTIPPEPIKRFGIGAQVGYYYVPVLNKWYPALGVGISFNIKNF